MKDDGAGVGGQRRGAPRFEGRFSARYSVAAADGGPGDERACLTGNLSTGGCLLLTNDAPLAASTRLLLLIQLPAGTWVRVHGTVRWSEPPRRASTGAVTEPGAMGVAFSDPMLPQALRQHLDACAQKKSTPPR